MKIGFDAKRAFHNQTGLGNYSRNLFEGLFEYYPDNEYMLYTPTLKHESAHKWFEQKVAGKAQVITPESSLAKTFSSAWRSLFLSKRFEKDQLDIFHGLSHELPMGIADAKIKKIVTIHDLIFMRYPQFFKMVDRMTYLKKVKYACKEADVIVSICEQTKTDLIEFLGVDPKKIKVVYQTCSPNYYQEIDESVRNEFLSRIEQKKPYLLYVGSLNERKNVLSLISSFAMTKVNKDVDLLIVGRGGDYEAQCRELASKWKLENNIKFLGNIGSDELPMLYQSASLFIFPSFFEGFGIPIIEAMFSKTPVITSSGSCFPEAAGPSSVYLDPNDNNHIENLAHEIESLLGDQQRQLKMIDDGYEYVQKFHIKNATANMFNLYQSL